MNEYSDKWKSITHKTFFWYLVDSIVRSKTSRHMDKRQNIWKMEGTVICGGYYGSLGRRGGRDVGASVQFSFNRPTKSENFGLSSSFCNNITLINMKLTIYNMRPQPATLYNTHPEPAPLMLWYVIYQLSITPNNQLVRCMLLLYGCPQLDIHNRNVCSSYSLHGISNFDQPTFLDWNSNGCWQPIMNMVGQDC